MATDRPARRPRVPGPGRSGRWYLGNQAPCVLPVHCRWPVAPNIVIGTSASVAARVDNPARLGVALGWGWADPVVGLLIAVTILVVLRQAAREICRG